MPGTKTYRPIFIAAHGELPHPCHWCGEPVTEWGRGKGVIHHLDGDHDNNDSVNLVCGHDGCHTSHHVTGRPVVPATRAKISEGNRGKPLSEDRRAKIAAALTGRQLSDEHRAAIAAGNQGKTFSAERRANISAALKGRTLTDEHRAAISRAKRSR